MSAKKGLITLQQLAGKRFCTHSKVVNLSTASLSKSGTSQKEQNYSHVYNRGPSYDGEAKHSYQRSTRRRQQFMAMLSLLAKENSVLRDHLENAPRISKYTCPDIQNEIIFFPAKQIFDGIIDNCKRSVIYVDETTDVTNKEQIFICIRFVGRKEDGKHLIREEFLTFVHAGKGTNVSSRSSSLYFLTR